MDPFRVLGVPPDAGADEIRTAYRQLARAHHPDVGGDAARMAELTAAYRSAIEQRSRTDRSVRRRRGSAARSERDIASFTVGALPVVAYEALLLVAGSIGDVSLDEPPYLLEFLIREGGDLWCRCDLVPDAGSTTVSVTVSPAGDEPLVRCDEVRDLLVRELNELDW